MEIWVPILFAVLALPGVFATLVPTLPGIPYIYTLALIFGFVNGWETFTPIHITILTGILILSILTDYFAGLMGAKFGGANGRSLKIGFICLVVGTIILPPFGGFLGLFLGVLLSELTQLSGHVQAFKTAGYSLAGALVGVFINFSLAILFYTLFLIFMF